MSDHKYMWNYAGTALLISIWSNSSVQTQLRATLRNQAIWDGVARYMSRRGFNVNGRQCRTRIKNILVRYRDAKKSGNICATGIEPFFHDIDRVMSLRNTQTISRNTQTVPNSLPPDPLPSQEESRHYEPIIQFDEDMNGTNAKPEMLNVDVKTELLGFNVKSEMASPPSESEDNIEDPSDGIIHGQFVPPVEENPLDEDQLTSACTAPIARTPSHLHSCINNERNEPNHKEEDIHKTTNGQQSQKIYRTRVLRMERLISRIIHAQSTAVNKILTAQHDLAMKLLEADRERQLRLENKLDHILEKVNQLLPAQSLPISVSQEHATKERHERLSNLLDRLDKALPRLASVMSTSRPTELDRIQEVKLENVVKRLEQTFS